MKESFFHSIGKAAQWVAQPVAGIIHQYNQKRRVKNTRAEIFRLDRAGKYPQAAALYTQLAGEFIQANPLIYQFYSHESFSMWLKAKKADQALLQAGDVLRVLSDTGWLGESSDAIDDLSKMVGELYVAGYLSEAGRLSGDINQQLVAHGLPARAAAPLKPGQFPSICPQCGGVLPSSNDSELKCPYCGSIIHAI
jgi:hypothetical protein